MTVSNLSAARAAILDAALVHVPAQGWTQAVLDDASARASVDAPLAARAFPDGPIGLIEAFHARADRAMEVALEERELEALKIRERIALAVQLRLQSMADHRAAARRALAVQALPAYLPRSMATLYRTADAIWYAIGDGSTDISFYTRRATVAGIYAATTLVWLADESSGFSATMAFLERRIAGALLVGAARARFRAMARSGLASLRPGGPRGRPLGRRGRRPVWRRSLYR